MKRIVVSLACLGAMALPTFAQNQPIKFIADTLVLQASGTYETDPDLATLSFDISSQDKELTQDYAKATQAMQQIVSVARRDGLKKEEISTGVLTLTPSYDLVTIKTTPVLRSWRDCLEGSRFYEDWPAPQ